jgi:AraC-like DNA-binding protein
MAVRPGAISRGLGYIGEMGYAEYPADAALRDCVKCFWSIADGVSDEIQEVWPDGCVELIFTPGNTFRVNGDGLSERFPRAVVVGLQTGIMRVRAEGEVRLLGARMLPLGLKDWQPVELERLADRIEPLLGPARFQEAVGILEAWLLGRPKIEDTMTTSLRKVYANGGNISVADLAGAQRVSSRHLQRTFAAQLGISPKTLTKIVRFAQSWSMMLSRPELTLAELALELGYSDQAHFSNEFRSFSRQSPRSFRKRWGTS